MQIMTTRQLSDFLELNYGYLEPILCRSEFDKYKCNLLMHDKEYMVNDEFLKELYKILELKSRCPKAPKRVKELAMRNSNKSKEPKQIMHDKEIAKVLGLKVPYLQVILCRAEFQEFYRNHLSIINCKYYKVNKKFISLLYNILLKKSDKQSHNKALMHVVTTECQDLKDYVGIK